MASSSFLSQTPTLGRGRRIFSAYDGTRSSPSIHQDFSITYESPSVLDSCTATSISRLRAPARNAGIRAPSRAMSAATSITGYTNNHGIICAISEARGVSPSLGVAFLNLSHAEIVLSQISDNPSYTQTISKVVAMGPSTILVVGSLSSANLRPKIVKAIQEELEGVRIISLDRKYWSEMIGREYVQNYAFLGDIPAITQALDGNFYAVCAFSAVMRYAELQLNLQFAANSLVIKYEPSEKTMMIDRSTRQSLELIQNLLEAKSKECLFGLLNHTQTPMGARLLRNNILQPSTDVNSILQPRYEAVEELSTNETIFFELRKALQSFSDIEKLLTWLVILPAEPSLGYIEQAINQVLMLKKFLLATGPLYDALVPAHHSNLLVGVRDKCHPSIIDPVLQELTATISQEATFAKSALELRHQRTYAVKSAEGECLDAARKMFQEKTEELHDYAQALNTDLGLNAELKYDKSRRYYLRVQASDFEEIQRRPQPIFINIVKTKGLYECQTHILCLFNEKISDLHKNAINLSDGIVMELLHALRPHIPAMFHVCSSIALIDMLSAFAYVVTTEHYVRPNMRGSLALEQARHPILDKMSPGGFIPNDYHASNQSRFQIVTGCNMSGKSTYIRSVAFLQIMAQIGSFVPATYASFSIIANLFSRVSTDDSIESNMSSFSREMREMAFILRYIPGVVELNFGATLTADTSNVDDKSLVIIDELGRGTSTRDGLAIAVAMSEALIESQAVVYFATHFRELAKALADRPGVVNLHLTTETTHVEGELPKMTMLYKLGEGPAEEENYGIDLARAFGFPAPFIAKAQAVSDAIRQQADANKRDSDYGRQMARRRLTLNVHEMLAELYNSGMDEEALRNMLVRLQNDYTNQMFALQFPDRTSTTVTENGRAQESPVETSDEEANEKDKDYYNVEVDALDAVE